MGKNQKKYSLENWEGHPSVCPWNGPPPAMGGESFGATSAALTQGEISREIKKPVARGMGIGKNERGAAESPHARIVGEKWGSDYEA